MEKQVRCENCGWHLVNVSYDSEQHQDFYIKKDRCPGCKQKNNIRIKKEVEVA